MEQAWVCVVVVSARVLGKQVQVLEVLEVEVALVSGDGEECEGTRDLLP